MGTKPDMTVRIDADQAESLSEIAAAEGLQPVACRFESCQGLHRHPQHPDHAGRGHGSAVVDQAQNGKTSQ